MMVKKCYACGKEFIPHGKHNLYCEDCRERETEKDNRCLENLEPSQLEDIAGAVLAQASYDYKSLIKTWHKAHTSELKKEMFTKLGILSKWFKDGFELWGFGLDGATVQKKLNKYAFEDEDGVEKITNMKGE